mmetsp:Transcript_5727/g.9338  ORF Transcript_5727/g.9338 Transcript_5727/m.9338 type:complete len:109 (+) Transcript_5727:2593-2919(+)
MMTCGCRMNVRGTVGNVLNNSHFLRGNITVEDVVMCFAMRTPLGLMHRSVCTKAYSKHTKESLRRNLERKKKKFNFDYVCLAKMKYDIVLDCTLNWTVSSLDTTSPPG